jgi:hypothetical protein
MTEVCHGLGRPNRPQHGRAVVDGGERLRHALVGLDRLDDGSVGPDSCSEDQGEREASPAEENTPAKQLGGPSFQVRVAHSSYPYATQYGAADTGSRWCNAAPKCPERPANGPSSRRCAAARVSHEDLVLSYWYGILGAMHVPSDTSGGVVCPGGLMAMRRSALLVLLFLLAAVAGGASPALAQSAPSAAALSGSNAGATSTMTGSPTWRSASLARTTRLGRSMSCMGLGVG